MSFDALTMKDTLLNIMIRFAVNLTVFFILIRLICYKF